MVISVDIKNILSHISILSEEKKRSDELLHLLQDWLMVSTAAMDGKSPIIESQITTVSRFSSAVAQRIALLESVADRFTDTNSSVSVTLEDAISLLNHISQI